MAIPPVYVGNYEYDADERDLEQAFKKYGPVKSIEYKSGFCFVHFEDQRDAEECIRGMDGREWGRQGRRLRVEQAKNDANVRAREAARRDAAEPNTTLFVAGFDPRTVSVGVLERAFEGYGRMRRCEVKKTFAFVEYDNIEDAKEALSGMHGQKVDGREITVEYVTKKGGGGGGRERGGRDRERGGGRRDDRGGGRDRGGRDRSPRDRYGGGGGGGGRGYDDRRDDRGRRYGDDRGGGGGGGGRDRYNEDRGGRDDRRGGRGGGGGPGGGGRDRSRSYERRERDRRRRSPSFDRRDRSRSPAPRRGRSPEPRRDAPRVADRRRTRSPAREASPPRGGGSPPRRGDSPSRSRSPMRDMDE